MLPARATRRLGTAVALGRKLGGGNVDASSKNKSRRRETGLDFWGSEGGCDGVSEVSDSMFLSSLLDFVGSV